MKNLILGSGIVGLLAKEMLGSDWKVIPFYRSRFFSYNPALDDNFIISDPQTDGFIRGLVGNVNNFTYKRAWSVGGQIVPEFNSTMCAAWLNKIFGIDGVPSQSMVYYNNRMNLPIYDIRINSLYENLLNNNIETLKYENSLGKVTEIGDHYIIRNGIKEDFDNIISTIPLNVLRSLMKLPDIGLRSKALHYYHIQTESLDFEGYNQLFDINSSFDFYRASLVSPGRYLFYCHNEITNPGIYFMPILRSFDFLDGTSVDRALPMGPAPSLDSYESMDIFCVGSYAQWDWCMDVGSCVLRLQRYSQRGFKPFKRQIMDL